MFGNTFTPSGGYPTPADWTPTWGALAPMVILADSTIYARFVQVGKLVFFWVRGTIQTGGAPSNTILISTPIPPLNNGSTIACVATVVDGAPNVARGLVSYSGTDDIRVVRQVAGTDANYNIAAGIIVIASGVYEAA